MSFDAGAITGGIHFDISEFEHGILGAEALSHIFPTTVVEFLEHPLLAFGELAKETFAKLGELVEGVAGHFHEMGLAAAKSGLDPQTFSTLAAAAKASGVDVMGLGNAFKFLEDRAANALRGDESGVKAFSDLGIKTRELKTLMRDPEEMFYRVADAIARIPNQALRTQAAMDLMSRAGTDMLPFLQQGRAGIQSLAEEMGRLGAGVNENEAGMGEKWGLMEAKFDAAWMGIKKAIAEPILKILSDHMDQIVPAAEHAAEAIRSGVGEAWQWLSTHFTKALPTIEEAAKVIGHDLSVAAERAGPVLASIGHVLKGVWEASLPVMKEVVHLLKELDHLLEPIASKLRSLATEGFNKIGDFLHHSAAGLNYAFNGDMMGFVPPEMRAGPPAPASPHIDVKAPITLDTVATSDKMGREIARKINPKLQAAVQHYQRSLTYAARQQVAKATGGRAH